ncbi:MAG: GNAT family N-acetyltransferase [Planctomycetota bacterium]
MPHPQPFVTERLAIRPLRSDDLDDYALIFSDPEVMRYIGDGTPRSPERSRAAFEWSESLFTEHSIGIFAVTSCETGELIGDVLLVPILHSSANSTPSDYAARGPHIELGYRLASRAWKKGYATEAARAVLDYAVAGPPALSHLVGVTNQENIASQRVLTKLGFLDHGTTDMYYNMSTRYFLYDASNSKTPEDDRA